MRRYANQSFLPAVFDVHLLKEYLKFEYVFVFKCVKASKTLSAQGLCMKCRKSRLNHFLLSITIIIYLPY